MLYYVFYTLMPNIEGGDYKIFETKEELPLERIRAKCVDFTHEIANTYIYDLFGHEDNLSLEEIEEFNNFINNCYFDYKVFYDKTTAQNFIENDGFYE